MIEKLWQLSGYILVLTFCLLSNSQAKEHREANYKPVIKAIIETVIIPGYDKLSHTAEKQVTNLASLCESADTPSLNTARIAFKNLVIDWSNVEMFRFGPAVKQNRQERLFFWPDRRSRGIRQVEKILTTEDPTALIPSSLHKKSVAVQGITALEYVLFGKGSDTLANQTANNYRCRYALSIATVIHKTVLNLLSDWEKNDSFALTMKNSGPDNPVFKNDQEVIRNILQRSAELVQAITALKLGPALRKTRETARPKLFPLWRSNLTFIAIKANLKSILVLQNNGKLGSLLSEDNHGLASGLTFEIKQVIKTLKPFSLPHIDVREIATSKNGYEKLTYIQHPLNGARQILAEFYPQALGITMGFNSLDGD